MSRPLLRSGLVLLACLAIMAGCDRIFPRQTEGAVPDVEDVRAVYRKHGLQGRVSLDGTTVVYTAEQDGDQLRRGGSLWASVGPFIYVFTPATRETLETWDGVAAVRVITRSGGTEVARATLRRGVLSDVLWRRSLNILGRALQQGTDRPRVLEELVDWGEKYTEFRYNPAFVPR